MLLFLIKEKKRTRIMFRKHHKGHHRHKPELMGGELIVTGEDEVHIELPKRPKEILSLFSRHCEWTPCNPNHYDELKCFVCKFHRGYCLVIKWNVSNTRKIVWEAIF